mmetsp:Transcript_13009/g.28253  ORF Transcript_13009/g.28253 Transcript_13009/m.28253 type:complete len:585 (-) Transcript_13009:161-1915(-)|eukprot:CAMPEP_0172323220 /NCGR_PEP_ID=MMETSP1058-20130122/48175_1 /TAXON_ID=83371 /ORGANISM="Detonula confervacea, Strain CCMP 353" /LENGTH=584 /DNA_ID=CAMNT_0013039173 /DNA_START=449 /DNA_END=2203 /DNA_ORIENTATION=-
MLEINIAEDLYTGAAAGTFTLKRHEKLVLEICTSILTLVQDNTDIADKCNEIFKRVQEMGKLDRYRLSYFQDIMNSSVGDERVSDLENIALQTAAVGFETFNERLLLDAKTDHPSPATLPVPALDPNQITTKQSSPSKQGNNTTKNAANKKSKKKKRRKKHSDIQSVNAKTFNRNTLLTEGQCTLEAIILSQSSNDVVVTNFRLAEIAVAQIEEAFINPQNPNLLRIPTIMRSLAIILQNTTRYQKRIATWSVANSLEFEGSIIEFETDISIGKLGCKIDNQRKKNENNVPVDVATSLLLLKAAIQRHKLGSGYIVEDTDSELAESDVNEMKALFQFQLVMQNLLNNLINCSIVVYVESELTMEQLYKNHESKFMPQARALWETIRPEDPFDPKTTMLEYRESVLIPGLASEEHEDSALEVANNMKDETTQTRGEERSKTILSAFDHGQRRKIDGSPGDFTIVLSKEEDYCAGKGGNASARRCRGTTLISNFTLRKQIMQRLPQDIFPLGFYRALLTSSPSFIQRSCNFHSQKLKKEFFKGVHDRDSAIVKDIEDEFKNFDIGEGLIVIDRDDHIDSLRKLLGV